MTAIDQAYLVLPTANRVALPQGLLVFRLKRHFDLKHLAI